MIIDTVVVVLLTVLVAGLLRSHADILRALHSLGAGLGDPAGDGSSSGPVRPGPVPIQLGPPLPGERSSTTAPDVDGVSPTGDGVAVAVTGRPGLTLLAFLSSGCSSCAGFWAALADPAGHGLPGDVRTVAVTKGPEVEIRAEVARRAAPGLTVVMSTAAWGDYEVPGSPFFVLVDGAAGRRVGEGVANSFDQVAELVRRARLETDEGGAVPAGGGGGGGESGGSRSRAFSTGLDGAEREARNDRELAAAGILPGDPSLYPGSLEDVFPRPGPAEGTGKDR